MNKIIQKWRPSMAFVVTLVCGILLTVPLVTMLGLQLWTNRFVNEAEASLLKQAAIYSSAYSLAFQKETNESNSAVPGYYLPPNKRVFWNARVRTFDPLLNLRRDVIETVQAAPSLSGQRPENRYQRIAPDLARLSENASRTTLSSILFLDHQGTDILSAKPLNYASSKEVREALRGNVGAALRRREDTDANRSFISFIRGTGFRVFISYPVIYKNRVIGAVYMNRTPRNLSRYLSEEGRAFVILALTTIIGAAIVGTLLVRMMLRPVQALRDQSSLVANGVHDELEPLAHYGMREIAELGGAIMDMAHALSFQNKEISIYTRHVTHELKSPVTAIIGAAELLFEDDLPEDTRRNLQTTIASQGQRMERLLNRLREMTNARLDVRGTSGKLKAMVPNLSELEVILTKPEAVLPISERHGATILAHMAQNAQCHGASQMTLDWDDSRLLIADNGQGFALADLERLSEPFYTTRREQGGTGMGLSIVASILDLYGGHLTPVASLRGAVFEICFTSTS